jgi:hypothetical protein
MGLKKSPQLGNRRFFDSAAQGENGEPAACGSLDPESHRRSISPTSQSPLCRRAFFPSEHRSAGVQARVQLDLTENKGQKGNRSDRILGSARILGVGLRAYRILCLFMLSCLIFKSSVDRGIPSLAAAPFGPATLPLLSARAASMSSFS